VKTLAVMAGFSVAVAAVAALELRRMAREIREARWTQ